MGCGHSRAGAEVIPTIESIVEGLLAGTITASDAVSWLHQHAADAHTSLRDYFAAKAPAPPNWWLRGYSDAWEKSNSLEIAAQHYAQWQFSYADAMLLERAK